jgi:hypothetical protein
VIEQAIHGVQAGGGRGWLARSPGFADDWLAEAEQLCAGFGERPPGVACPGCVFARPFGARDVAVVQVADQGGTDGVPGPLGFRLLVLPRRLYAELGGDPFHLADQLPPPWNARGELPALEPTLTPAPRRTVADIQGVLNVPTSATLLGGVQALVDGGHVAFERGGPDPGLLRSLWALLPASTRAELWPASFAFGNALHFDALVVPRAAGPDFHDYVFEEQAGDYPEGRYELALQLAAEAGDQAELDALFSRRSRSQTLRLAVVLLLAFVLVPILLQLLWPPAPTPKAPTDRAPAKAPAEAKP